MGKYVGMDALKTVEGEGEEPSQTRQKKINPADWDAELLVPPHNAQNVREVERLHSQHPAHESSLMIAENRLLCKSTSRFRCGELGSGSCGRFFLCVP